MGGTSSTHVRNAYSISVGKSEGKKQLGRLRCRWEITLECILWK